MRTIFKISPIGRINRRDLPTQIADDEVLSRENLQVLGNGKEKRNRKVPGASRFSGSDTGDYYISGIRHYFGPQARKTFALNNGRIYHIDDNGNESATTPVFAVTAVGAWEVIQVSGNSVLFFSEGVDTGMYSHDGNIANDFTKEMNVSLNLVGMVSHLDRMFGFEENSEDLVFSKNLDPTNFTDSTDAGTITIGAKRGSKIMAIVLLSETLFIFKQDSIWRLTGRTPSEFEVREVHPFLGTSARRSVIPNDTGTGVFFLASDFEFYFFGGTADSTVMLSYKAAIGGDLTKDVLPIINRDKADTATATFHNKVYRCAFTENGKVTHNMEWCFDTVNETDFFTRDFNISCYIPWTRTPDKLELLTGRRDIGLLMKMYQGLNVDNGASSPSMPFKLQTKFMGSGEPRNIRFKRASFNLGVLGAEPINARYYLDGRTAKSDAGQDDWVARGETKTVAGIKIVSQRTLTSRVNLDYGKSKGQSISFQIDHTGKNVDFELASIDIQAVVKPGIKQNEKVGI